MAGWLFWLAMPAIVLALLLQAPGCGGSDQPSQSQDATKPTQTQAIKLNGKRFELDLALDDQSRELGLSDRQSIAENGGMLFVFPYPRRASFVMRRCYVPIDLIFADEDGYIDSMHAMQVIEPIGGPAWKNPPTGYASSGRVLYAIELKGGTLADLDLKRGDRLDLPLEALQSKAQ